MAAGQATSRGPWKPQLTIRITRQTVQEPEAPVSLEFVSETVFLPRVIRSSSAAASRVTAALSEIECKWVKDTMFFAKDPG